jgi:hypothetical protein
MSPSWTDITYERIVFGSRLNCGECLAADDRRMTNTVIFVSLIFGSFFTRLRQRR